MRKYGGRDFEDAYPTLSEVRFELPKNDTSCAGHELKTKAQQIETSSSNATKFGTVSEAGTHATSPELESAYASADVN